MVGDGIRGWGWVGETLKESYKILREIQTGNVEFTMETRHVICLPVLRFESKFRSHVEEQDQAWKAFPARLTSLRLFYFGSERQFCVVSVFEIEGPWKASPLGLRESYQLNSEKCSSKTPINVC